MNDESTLNHEPGGWVVQVKLIWHDPPRIHSERIELGECSEHEARQAYNVIVKMIEAEYGSAI